jgi:hypothetical protein
MILWQKSCKVLGWSSRRVLYIHCGRSKLPNPNAANASEVGLGRHSGDAYNAAIIRLTPPKADGMMVGYYLESGLFVSAIQSHPLVCRIDIGGALLTHRNPQESSRREVGETS